MIGRRFSQALGACVLMGVAVLANAADDECELDNMMRDARVQMDKMAVGIYENSVTKPMNTAIKSAPSVKTASCLPMLDTLDMLMRMRIPSMGGLLGGVMTMIRDMACDMANSFLEDTVNGIQISYSDPLGVASIGIGGTTGEGGSQIESYDISKVIQDAAINQIKDVAGSVVKEGSDKLRDQLPTGPVDRTPRIESTINNELKGALNGL